MDIKIDKEICQRAVSQNGSDSQLNMVIEECLELASALLKLKNRSSSETPGEYHKRTFDVHDEAADVLIMMEQIKLILNPEVLQERVDFKLNRLNERLKIKAKNPF